MRRTYTKLLVNLLAISTFFLLSNIFSVNVFALEQLNIDSKTVVFEGEEFPVSVYVETDSGYEYLMDVSIGFNNTEYVITEDSEDGEVVLVAPSVTEDQTFYITAKKSGYDQGYLEIMVRDKGKLALEIVPWKHIIDEGEEFYVTVLESISREPVDDVNVYISNQGSINQTTNSDGIAFLKAPENFEEITVNARKNGYLSDSIDVKIKLKENPIIGIVTDRYFLIFVCVVILIMSILFVNYRQEKNIYNRSKQITDKKVVDKYGPELETPINKKEKFELEAFSGPPVRVKSSEDKKVEEIRISKPNKAKETMDIRAQDGKNEEKSKKSRELDDSDWYKGKDELKYELDKLTGELDEEGLDKWYEGIEDLKKKVDEKIKKNKEKKKNN